MHLSISHVLRYASVIQFRSAGMTGDGVMSRNCITVAYEGRVSPRDAKALLSHFAAIAELLSEEVADAKEIDWEVTNIGGGSASISLKGTHDLPESVQAVVMAWETIGTSLKDGSTVPYSDKVKRHIDGIAKQLNARVTAVRFLTASKSFTIHRSEFVPQLSDSGSFTTLGSVRGLVQTISTRRKLSLTVYDHLFDKAVVCHLNPDQEDQLLEYMNKEVLVTGRVTRDALTGQARSVREITHIEEISEIDDDSYKVTRGALAWMGNEPAEKMIKRAWNG